MAVKTPVKATFTGSDVTGLAEYQSADFIGVADGGSGAVSFTAGILTADGTNAFTTVSAPTGTIVGTSDTQTLTNKTIDASNNSISNIGVSSLTTSSFTLVDDSSTSATITLGETLQLLGGTGVSSTVSGDSVTFAIDNTVTTNSGTQTLTNKTIDASSNTLSNIANSSLTNSSITVTDGTTSTATSLGGTITFSGTNNEVEVSESSGTLTFGLPNDVTVGGALTVTGNLTVNGTTTTVNSTNTTLDDNLLELNSGATSNANDSGIIIERGSTGDNAIFAWDESADKFTLGTTTATASDTGNLTISTGTLVANLEGSVTGNADTATALETARTIAGQSFDGTADISIASTDLSDTASIALLTSTQTLTNKTIDLSNNTLTGTTSQFNTALSDGSFATLAGTETLTNKTINALNNTISNIGNSSLSNSTITIRDDSSTEDAISLGETLIVSGGTGITSSVGTNAITIDIDSTVATLSGSQTLTNKTIDASSNTLSNIGDSQLSSGISATKIADGSVSNTEFQYLNGVTSAIQTQLDSKASNAFAIAQAVALG